MSSTSSRIRRPRGARAARIRRHCEPYEFTFVAGYSGNGIDPRPFPIWARAVDTSTNESNVVLLEMVVLPNQTPVIGDVRLKPSLPWRASSTPGRRSVRPSTVCRIRMEPSCRSMFTCGTRGSGFSMPLRRCILTRPASGDWSELAPPTLDFELPMDLPEGAELSIRAHVTDSAGATADVESSRFTVADDQIGPVIEDVAVRSADGGEAQSFAIGDRLYVEFVARDVETEVTEATVSFDRIDIFPSTLEATGFPATCSARMR